MCKRSDQTSHFRPRKNIGDARNMRGRSDKDSFEEIIRERIFIRRDYPTFAKHENAARTAKDKARVESRPRTTAPPVN
jgi:hypothetical protein